MFGQVGEHRRERARGRWGCTTPPLQRRVQVHVLGGCTTPPLLPSKGEVPILFPPKESLRPTYRRCGLQVALCGDSNLAATRLGADGHHDPVAVRGGGAALDRCAVPHHCPRVDNAARHQTTALNQSAGVNDDVSERGVVDTGADGPACDPNPRRCSSTPKRSKRHAAHEPVSACHGGRT